MVPRTLKLRVYPNETQKTFLFLCFRGRQWAYHAGIVLYQSELKAFELDRQATAAIAVAHPSSVLSEPSRPKRRSGAFLSQRLTERLVSLRAYQERAAELAEAFEGEAAPHPQAWLLDVPRCVFSQGFMDYQKAITAAFTALKEKPAALKRNSSPQKEKTASKSTKSAQGLPEAFSRGEPSRTRGFPTFYSLFDQQTARFQIDKPATNQKHLETWHAGKVRLGNLVLRYKDPTALPEKLPSLVTVTRNQVGQYFATFLTEEPRRYTDPAKQAKLEARQARRRQEVVLARTAGRAMGGDPNLEAEYIADTQGLVFSIAESQAVRNNHARLEAKQKLAARHLARTQRYRKASHPSGRASDPVVPTQKVTSPFSSGSCSKSCPSEVDQSGVNQLVMRQSVVGRLASGEGVPASNRHRKARQVLAKVHLDRRNQHEDFLQKKTSALATFYPRHAREPLDPAKMIQANGAKDTKLKGGSGAQAQRFGVAKGMSRAAFGRQRILIEQKLAQFHPEPGLSELVTLPAHERSTQCCSHCHEERLTVPRGAKAWTCPYCHTWHHRDACAAQNVCDKGFGGAPLSATKPKSLSLETLQSLREAGFEFDAKTGFPIVKIQGFTGAGQRRQRMKPVPLELFATGEGFEPQLFRRLLRFGTVRIPQEALERVTSRA